jgi:diketogulonate reductase-like aldo/keto reductase
MQIYDDATAQRLTLQAIEAGFRSFFSSPEAGNQLGFARAICASAVPREQLFIAGSLLSDDADSFRSARRKTTAALDASMTELSKGGVDRLDLLMLERPARSPSAIRGQWMAMQEGRQAAGATLLGVANFGLSELDVVLKYSSIPSSASKGAPPCVNQLPISLGVRMDHAGLVRAHAARGVAVQAWGPLGGPDGRIPPAAFTEAENIGRSLRGRAGGLAGNGRPTCAVLLRWVLQQGAGFVVHSRVKSHLREDLEALEFELSLEQMQRLNRAAGLV